MRISTKLALSGAFVILCLALAVSADSIVDEGTETLANASDYFGITPNAAKIREKIPRPYGGVVDFDPERIYGDGTFDEEYAKSYAISIGSTLAYGIFLGFAALLVGVIWLFSICCKCCCKCLGCIEEKGKEIEEFTNNKRNKIIVLSVIAVLVLLITIFLGLGLRYNNQISDSITGEEGFTGIVDTLYEDGIDTFTDIMTKISNLVSSVSSAADQIAAFAINGVNRFTSVPGEIATSLNGIGDTLAGVNITATVGSETRSFPCSICTSVGATAYDAANQINSSTSGILSSLNTGLNQTIEGVLNQRDQIESQINDALSDVNNTVNDYTDDFEKYWDIGKQWINKVSDGRETTNGVFFGLPLIGVITLIVALLLRSPFLVTTNAVVYWCTWLFLSIPLTIHIPFALIFSDVCIYVQEKETNVTGYLAQARDICLEGEPIAEALNLTEYLNYRDYIQLDQLTFAQNQLDSALNFTTLSDYQSQLDALSINDFQDGSGNTPTSAIDDALAAYNGVYSSSYTRDDIGTAPPSTERDVILALISCETQILSLIDDLRNQTSGVLGQAETLKDNVVLFNGELRDLLNDVILPLFDRTDELILSFNCKFLGEAYVDMKEAMCHDLLDGVTYVALYAFLVIIFAIPTTFIWCTLATIIRNQNLKEHIEKFENVGSPREMDETGSLPRIRPKGAATSYSPRANAGRDDDNLDDVDIRKSSPRQSQDYGDTRTGDAAPGYEKDRSSSGEKD